MESTPNSTTMAGKVCLVTGATSGIGKVTATALAAQGAEVIVAGRNQRKNVHFTYELARRLGGSRVTANALHPGHVATDMWRTNFPIIGPALKWVMGFFALTPEQGADNTIYLVSSPDVEGITGEYSVEREPAQSSPLSYDEGVAQKLWEVSETLTAPHDLAVEPGIKTEMHGLADQGA